MGERTVSDSYFLGEFFLLVILFSAEWPKTSYIEKRRKRRERRKEKEKIKKEEKREKGGQANRNQTNKQTNKKTRGSIL